MIPVTCDCDPVLQWAVLFCCLNLFVNAEMDKWLIKKRKLSPHLETSESVNEPPIGLVEEIKTPPQSKLVLDSTHGFPQTSERIDDEPPAGPSTSSSVPTNIITTPKRHKIKKRSHRFNNLWLEDDNFKSWLIKSNKSKKKGSKYEYAFCKVCQLTIFPNKSDITRHGKRDKHLSMMKTIHKNESIEVLLDKSHYYKVKRAEIKLAAALIEGNVPFLFMDTLTPLLSQIFPDSRIANDIACKRSKTTSIIKDNLGKHFLQEICAYLQTPGNFFSLVMDETTDIGAIKQCAFTVTYFCDINNKVLTRFFNMVEVAAGKAEDLYECLKSCIEKNNIPLKNLVGFASDTTNVMVGEHKSVFSHLKSNLPEIVLVKCSCHMIHLCSSKACLELPRSVEDLVRNIGSHFSRSFCRQEKFREFQSFFGTEIHKILLPSQTRWLSLEQACSRVVEQYEPLKEYFRLLSFEDPSHTTDQIFGTMINKYTKAYLEFLSYILNILNNFNTLFQSETPLLHKLKPEVTKLLKTIYSNIIDITTFYNKNVFNFDHNNPTNFVSLEKIYLGISATETLLEIKNEQNFDITSMNTFITSCLKFYLRLISEIKERFTFDDNLFEIIDILEPKQAQNHEPKTLLNVLKRFSFLKDYVSPQDVDNEWQNHALLDHTSLGLDPNLPADEYWKKVFMLKNPGNIPIFKNLRIVIGLLLVLPFSNASVERLFSSVKAIKTEHRNRLKTETMVGILVTKDGLKNEGGVLKFSPTEKMLKSVARM